VFKAYIDQQMAVSAVYGQPVRSPPLVTNRKTDGGELVQQLCYCVAACARDVFGQAASRAPLITSQGKIPAQEQQSIALLTLCICV
jgi:hypothetical protein